MSKQTIVTISREYGSGGHEIGCLLSEKLGIPMYDRRLIIEIAEEMGMDPKDLEEFDEHPKHWLGSRRVNGHSNSMEDILTEKQAAWIHRKAESGESFIIVGRRAKEELEGSPVLVSIFVTGDEDFKVKRIMEDRGLDEATARSERLRIDRIRRNFHNSHSDYKWGDSRCYDIIVNSAKLGTEQTAEILCAYIRGRIAAVYGGE